MMDTEISIEVKTENLPSWERLAQALEVERDPRLGELIQQARLRYFDDYAGPLQWPKSQLVDELKRLEKFELIIRIIGGEFDSTDEEEQAWKEGQE